MEEQLAKQAQEAGGSFERGELSLSSARQEELLTEDGGSSEGEIEVETDPAESMSERPDGAADVESSSARPPPRTPSDHSEL